jgi:hypothetical protein
MHEHQAAAVQARSIGQGKHRLVLLASNLCSSQAPCSSRPWAVHSLLPA